MDVLNATDRPQEEGQVISLGEGCELRRVVKTHIDNLLYVCFQKALKEVLRSCLRKADGGHLDSRQDLHSAAITLGGGRPPSGNATLWDRNRYAAAS